MKMCSVCERAWPDSFFYKKRSGLTNRCNECEKSYQREYYIKNRAKRIAAAKKHSKKSAEENRIYLANYLKTHSCVDCGEKDILVLQFDHKGDKKFNVSEMVGSRNRPCSLKTIQNEVAKCDVRCANCHTRKTAKESGYWKLKFV